MGQKVDGLQGGTSGAVHQVIEGCNCSAEGGVPDRVQDGGAEKHTCEDKLMVGAEWEKPQAAVRAPRWT